MSDPIYPGAQARLTASAADYDGDPSSMGPSDVISVRVTITDPAGNVVVNSAAMAWSATELLWLYLWAVPSDAGGKTFRTLTVVTALDGGTQPAYGEVWVDPLPVPPTVPVVAQPSGVPGQSEHFLQPWCDESDLPGGRLTDSNGARIADLNLGWMIAAATDLLYWLSGRKYRTGRSVVRPSLLVRRWDQAPVLYPYSSMAGYGDGWGFEPGWLWSSVGAGWWSGAAATEVLLQAPVRRVNQVLVDGTPLSPNQYAVRDRRRLVRLDGAWPIGQTDTLASTQPGTFVVDYEWGETPPPAGRLACAELAVELAITFSGQDSARLPSRVLSIATQGVNVAVGDALEYLKEQLTGLPICDLFLQAVNPAKRRKRSVFLSPESVLNQGV